MKQVILAVCLLACAPASFAQQPLSISVKKLPDQPLPVTVTSGRLEQFADTSQLIAEYATEKGAEVEEIEFLLILHQDGRVISGEGWKESAASKGSILHETKLALKPGNKAILIVKSVRLSSETLKLNDDDMNEQMQAQVKAKTD